MAGHGIEAVLRHYGAAVVEQQDSLAVSFVGSHAAHVDGIVVVHIGAFC